MTATTCVCIDGGQRRRAAVTRQFADRGAQLRVRRAAAPQLGGHAGGEEAVLPQRLVVFADERIGRVVFGRPGGERRSQLARNGNEISGLAHRIIPRPGDCGCAHDTRAPAAGYAMSSGIVAMSRLAGPVALSLWPHTHWPTPVRNSTWRACVTTRIARGAGAAGGPLVGVAARRAAPFAWPKAVDAPRGAEGLLCHRALLAGRAALRLAGFLAPLSRLARDGGKLTFITENQGNFRIALESNRGDLDALGLHLRARLAVGADGRGAPAASCW